MQSRILEHLEALVGLDTQNPPRNITASHAIFDYLKRKLGTSFDFDTVDLGDGCVYLHARRGAPKTLFNFHIDTVPAASGYTADPHTLVVEGDRVTGLGACDIKGASACMLAALEEVPDANVGLLFSSDEEFGSSRCVRTFCKKQHDYDLVIVAEPTGCKAVFEHRGIMTGTATFSGVSGHASSGLADTHSALHRAISWASESMSYARTWDDTHYGPLNGIRFNIGRIEGGIKPNMIADHATIRFGFRPLPQSSNEELFAEFCGLASAGDSHQTTVEFTQGFNAPSLPRSENSLQKARSAALELGFVGREAVNFWTEASLFSQAGLAAFVYGPGDIAQAHSANEWVSLLELQEVSGQYITMLENSPTA